MPPINQLYRVNARPTSALQIRRSFQTMDDAVTSGQDEIRFDILRRLAEQAMTDLEFRAVARDDLLAALTRYGYSLNQRELALVLQFRETLADAGVDLFLNQANADEHITKALRDQM